MEAYCLTEMILHKLTTYYRRQGRNYSCFKCGRSFRDGDTVIVTGGHANRKRHYHENCYESMLI